MRHVVLKVFTQLLVSIKQRWIPHIHAHQPLKELLRYFYATKSSQIGLFSFLPLFPIHPFTQPFQRCRIDGISHNSGTKIKSRSLFGSFLHRRAQTTSLWFIITQSQTSTPQTEYPAEIIQLRSPSIHPFQHAI
eukprot:Sdes_comp20964_c0_seq12m18810